MSTADAKYYKERLLEEHVRLLLDDDPQFDARKSKIDDYRGKLSQLGVTYDLTARDWVITG